VPPTPEQEAVRRLDAVKNLSKVYGQGGSQALVRYRQDARNSWAYSEAFYTPGLREFFVHPCLWLDKSQCRHVVLSEAEAQTISDIQSLMMIMEAHPGQSADAWEQFRKKVEARWSGLGDGRLPAETEAVLRLYARVSGAVATDQSRVLGSEAPRKGEVLPPKTE